MTEKLMNFYEALSIAEKRKVHIFYDSGLPWTIIRERSNNKVHACLRNEIGVEWWPSAERSRKEVWSVEPEVKSAPVQLEISEKGIFFKSGGHSLEFMGDDAAPFLAWANGVVEEHKKAEVDQEKPAIPWKKFDADKIPEKEMEVVVLTNKNDVISCEWKRYQSLNGFDFSILTAVSVTHYCKRKDFPFPKD